jgi:hypothetical protein
MFMSKIPEYTIQDQTMTNHEFPTEKTSAGLQFIIPGTEKPKPARKVHFAYEDTQAIIPGAEKITNKQLIDRLKDKPIKPRVAQKALHGTALFGN